MIVASHNRQAELATSVACLCDQDYPHDRYEIIVVDDGSTDETPEALDRLERRGPVRQIRLPARRGQGPARNAGLAVAQGEIVIFVDSDAFAPPCFVRRHVECHRREGACFVDGPAIDVRNRDALARPPFSAWRVGCLAWLDWYGAHFVTVNASCRREHLIRAGGFDEAFAPRFGWEDVDLGLRLRQAGLRRVKHRQAYVLHYRGSRPDWSERGRKEEECGENAIRLYLKHPSSRTRRLIRSGRLRYDRMLACVGLRPDRVERAVVGGTSGWKRLTRTALGRAYLVQRYARGLRRGMQQHGAASLL